MVCMGSLIKREINL